MGVVSKLQRVSRLQPGYDCIRKPCGKKGCGTKPGSSHGVHCDDWIYTVHDGKRALSLVVFSGHFPETVPVSTSKLLTFPKPADLVLCAKVEAAYGRACFYLGMCEVVSTWCLQGEELWKTCGGQACYEQSEGFWRSFEAEFADHALGFLVSPQVGVMGKA
jgi:hypothetical protein